LAVAIFFSCLCGQQLRAEESGATGHTRCPACSRLVPIPSVQRANEAIGIDAAPESQALPMPAPLPTVPPLPIVKVQLVETAAIPPVRRAPRRTPRDYDDENLPYEVLDAPENGGARDIQGKVQREMLRQVLAKAEEELAQRRRRRLNWKLEKHWYEFLVYPPRATLQVMTLSVAWATAMALGVAFLPETWQPGAFALAFLFLPGWFLLLGYTFGGLQATLAAASKGHAGYVAWAGSDFSQVARGAVQGLFGFLAGPIVPAAVAFYFWQESGDLEMVDWLILIQLSVVAAGYWALVMLAIQQNYAFLDANPIAVLRLIHRLGYPVLLTALLVALVVVGHGLLMLDALEELHRSLGGWLQLVGGWAGLLFCLILLLRWFGVSSYRARKEGDQKSEAAG
jgi:hypothetical protein